MRVDEASFVIVGTTRERRCQFASSLKGKVS